MPINPDAVGETGGPVSRSWTSKDALLYAVGIGAGTDELAFTTENTHDIAQRVFPTFAVIIGGGGTPMGKVGSFNPALMVHGEQGIELLDEIPPDGEVESRGRIAGIWDKGSAAVLEFESESVDKATGKPLLKTRSMLFCRGEGGWGGDRGPSAGVQYPDNEPSHQVTYKTRGDQALTYRLSGSGVRGPGRLREADPARPVHLRLHWPGAAAQPVRRRSITVPVDEREILETRHPRRHADRVDVDGRQPGAVPHDQPGRRGGHRPRRVHVPLNNGQRREALW
ncbi:MAG: MaoC family dehydratase N-terminal domain-containing protein [Pseudomonadales bacterium]|nr:MaoC family dehydratase N-terminal domain-containing protein [Pseudomonadales bacterium]